MKNSTLSDCVVVDLRHGLAEGRVEEGFEVGWHAGCEDDYDDPAEKPA
jgi:hypothetical protein